MASAKRSSATGTRGAKAPSGASQRPATARHAPNSMTGHGAAQRQNAQFAIDVEIRSVNHRFLSLQIKLPGDFAAAEPDIEEIVRKRLHRGSVTVTVVVKRKGAAASLAVVDLEQAQAVTDAMRSLAKKLKLKGSVTLEMVAAAPGVLSTPRNAAVMDAASRELLRSAVSEALDGLCAERQREGEALAADLRDRVGALQTGTAAVEARVPRAMAEYRLRLKKRVEDLMAEYSSSLKEGDLAREIAILAERSDVAEEVSRLRAHIAELQSLLGRREPVGRRIDFLLQEMGREVNTTGSKSIDAEITNHVMNLKAELERIREQAANLE